MKWRSIFFLYRVRLRRHLAQEILALVGITVGVALLFASQISSESLTRSVEQLTSGVVGRARYQLVARSAEGFDQRLMSSVQHVPGVVTAVPVLEEPASVIGPAGERSIDLIGTQPRFAQFGGSLLRHFSSAQLAAQEGIALPASVAADIGAGSLQTVKLRIGADLIPSLVGAELTEREIGDLAFSPIAVAPLAYAQRITGMYRRVTRVFVLVRPGADSLARNGLERLARGRLNVEPANFEAALFKQAARPTTESTQLFAALSALVGFLFAFNAMLMTVPRRRRQIADLREDGYSPSAVVKVLIFDVLVLGLVGSMLGIGLGELLSTRLFHANPSYLSFAFPVGSQKIITLKAVAFSAVGGVAAAAFAVLLPLRREALARRPPARASRPSAMRPRIMFLSGLSGMAAATVVIQFIPHLAVMSVVLLAGSMLLLLPPLLGGVLAGVDRAFEQVKAWAPFVAVAELRSSATRARTLAVAATGAVAVFGSVAIQGAHQNLVHGLYRLDNEVSSVADVWIVPPGVNNLLTTTPFTAMNADRLARLPGVSSVRLYRAGLLDYGSRRIWVIAPPRQASSLVPPGQVVSGDVGLAEKRVAAGGWAVVSQTLADEHHLHIGQTFTLPAPRPVRLRIAALSTNMGWSPGSVIVSASQYSAAWGSRQATAYNVLLDRAVSAATVEYEIRRLLGPTSGLGVETVAQLNARKEAATRQGLVVLGEIAKLVLIGAILAMAAAMSSMLWQRRPRLAQLALDGLSRNTILATLLLETTILLGTGCTIGAVCGLYGEFAMTRALVAITGYPVIYTLGVPLALETLAGVCTIAVAIIAIPGYLAARVRPVLATR